MTYEQLQGWRDQDKASRSIEAIAWGVLVRCRISERRGNRTIVGYGAHLDERIAISAAMDMLTKLEAGAISSR
jgi:hypothetical protein